MVSSVALLDEICDEKRFQKNPSGPLEQVRNGVNDGLFTVGELVPSRKRNADRRTLRTDICKQARPDEPRWAIAHRVLMPAFGPVSIRAMFDDMHDIASMPPPSPLPLSVSGNLCLAAIADPRTTAPAKAPVLALVDLER